MRLLLQSVSAEETKFLIKKLKSFKKKRIALGGYRKNGKWFWMDGSDGPRKLPAGNKNGHVSMNNRFAGIYNGKLCNVQTFDAFLCEIK